MKLKSIRLIVVELTQSLKVYTDTKRQYGEWEIEPVFTIGYNDAGQIIQNIEVSVTRTIGTQHATIKAMTSFELELHTKEFIPSNDQDFLEYASMQQIAIAHARAFFIRETRGTKFAGDLIPIDAFEHAFRKIKLAVFNTDRMN